MTSSLPNCHPRRPEAQFLLAHGSRSPAWRCPFETLAARFRDSHPERRIYLCYLEAWTPTLPEAVADAYAAGLRRFRISPLFWSSGRHLQEDLPALLAALERLFPGTHVIVDPPLGEREVVVLAALRALEPDPATQG